MQLYTELFLKKRLFFCVLWILRVRNGSKLNADAVYFNVQIDLTHIWLQGQELLQSSKLCKVSLL